MTIRVKVATPYRKNGVWHVKTVEEDQEIPDELMSRHSIMCARCGMPGYPECRDWCDKSWAKEPAVQQSGI